MSKRIVPWWIKQRHNPQIGVYCVAMGQMSVRAAKCVEDNTLYGSTVMLRYETEKEYEVAVAKLCK